MTTLRTRDYRLARQLGAGLAAVVVVQLLLLQPARLVPVGSGGLALCLAFGFVAFLAWLLTGVRWPLIAWATVVLLVAIDQDLQHPPRDQGGFGDFAEGPVVAAPLLSARAPQGGARERFTRNGD
jgi:hypothetical protein